MPVLQREGSVASDSRAPCFVLPLTWWFLSFVLSLSWRPGKACSKVQVTGETTYRGRPCAVFLYSCQGRTPVSVY